MIKQTFQSNCVTQQRLHRYLARIVLTARRNVVTIGRKIHPINGTQMALEKHDTSARPQVPHSAKPVHTTGEGEINISFKSCNLRDLTRSHYLQCWRLVRGSSGSIPIWYLMVVLPFQVNGTVLHGRCHLNCSVMIKNLASPTLKFIVLRYGGSDGDEGSR